MSPRFPVRPGPSLPERVRVLYIGGYGRSGSTLMLRLLGELSGVISVGELVDIWERCFRQNQLCGCGNTFHACEFWQAVSREAFGVRSLDVPSVELEALRLRVQGRSAFPQLFWRPLRTPSYKRDHRRYLDVLSRLFTAIQKVSGATIIVDSSKLPQFGRLLSETPNVDLNVLHLVRDSRAVAHSWRRTKLRPEVHWKPEDMPRHSLPRSALEWDWCNTMLAAQQLSYTSYMRIRYEDFVVQPHTYIKEVAQKLELPTDNPATSEGSRSNISLSVSHTAAGNPIRFRKGEIRIARDDEWLSRMPASHKRLVTALTAPWLRQYGYPLRTKHPMH